MRDSKGYDINTGVRFMLALVATVMLFEHARFATASEGHEHAEEIRFEVKTLEDAVNATAYFQREVDTHIQRGELNKIHSSAFAARDAASSVSVFSTRIPEQNRQHVITTIQRIAALAVQLDKYGDAGQKAETAVFAEKLRKETSDLQQLTEVTATTEWKPTLIPTTSAGGHAESKCPHKAQHGGRFSMALNDAYHVEGTYPAPGEFRLYFYDKDSCPISASSFQGKLIAGKGVEVPLTQDATGGFLTARLADAPPPPVSMTAIVDLPHPDTQVVSKEHFSYNFYRLSKVPPTHGTTETIHAVSPHK